MFVRLRIMAHEALRNYMNSDHEPLFNDTTRLIYDVIKTAETNEAFASAVDFECATAFEGQTADDYDDLVNLFDCLDDAPAGLMQVLAHYGVFNSEEEGE